jgi:hypothetical protein
MKYTLLIARVVWRLLMRMLPRRKHRLDDNESGWA